MSAHEPTSAAYAVDLVEKQLIASSVRSIESQPIFKGEAIVYDADDVDPVVESLRARVTELEARQVALVEHYEDVLRRLEAARDEDPDEFERIWRIEEMEDAEATAAFARMMLGVRKDRTPDQLDRNARGHEALRQRSGVEAVVGSIAQERDAARAEAEELRALVRETPLDAATDPTSKSLGIIFDEDTLAWLARRDAALAKHGAPTD